MRLYLEISGEKHYIDEDIVKEYALHKGKITPFTGLEIKRENEPTVDNETIIALPTGIDDSEINTDINEIADSEDSSDVVEAVPEFSKGVKTPNEAPAKPEDTEAPILPTAIDDLEINGITDSKDSTDVVEPIPGSATVSDKSPVDAKDPNETLPKSEDKENPIHISEEMDYQENSTIEVNESATKKIPGKSKLDPYLPVMKELLEKYPDITNVQVYKALCEAGFDGGKTIVTDRLSQIRRRDFESKENH